MKKLVLLALFVFSVAWVASGAGGSSKTWLADVPAPTKGIGMMFNFPPMDPSKTQGPPGFFVRSASSIGKAGDPIVIPTAYADVHYEGELTIVIGKRATRVTPAQARDYILGYTCGMDGSPLVKDAKGERDVARSIAGKSADGVAPVGPKLVKELRPEGHLIVLKINGKEVERSHSKDLIWDPARIVSEISRTVTLEPGDVIFTGARQAIPRMQPGDVVEVEIEGIGTLRCPVVGQ